MEQFGPSCGAREARGGNPPQGYRPGGQDDDEPDWRGDSQPASPRGPAGRPGEADVPTLRREQRELEERLGIQMNEQFQRISEMLLCMQQTALIDRAAPGSRRAGSNTSRQLTDAGETGTVEGEDQPEEGGGRRPPQRDTRRPGTFFDSANRGRQPPRGGGSRTPSDWGDDEPDESRMEPVPSLPLTRLGGYGVLTGPMCKSLEELLNRAKIDDSGPWQLLVESHKLGGMAKAGITAISAGKLQLTDHFTGEEQMSRGGHIVPEGRGYFPFLQAFV